MNLKGKTVAFLGDSITAGFGASAPEKCFVSIFKQMTDSNVLNYGLSGTRIAPQKDVRIPGIDDMNFIRRVNTMLPEADAVVIFGGTNDFGHGDAPFGAFGDKTDASFCGSVYLLLENIVDKYPEIPIVVCTPLHREGEDILINEIGFERHPLIEYVKIIRKTAEMFSIPVLDLYANSGMSAYTEKQKNLYFKDGLHPNDRGYERIAMLMANFFESVVC